ncbi:hypothetical protein D1AOALGA4SA_10947 [Olavius algarvensis Delta 1 endosymbiont]|nr:hypothetical protein D1AOALGA4SA_10947 [Olavius algarvensis Delta 1 endosymbiont]
MPACRIDRFRRIISANRWPLVNPAKKMPWVTIYFVAGNLVLWASR